MPCGTCANAPLLRIIINPANSVQIKIFVKLFIVYSICKYYLLIRDIYFGYILQDLAVIEEIGSFEEINSISQRIKIEFLEIHSFIKLHFTIIYFLAKHIEYLKDCITARRIMISQHKISI